MHIGSRESGVEGRGSGVGSRGVIALWALAALLLGVAGPAAAQPAVPLQAAMLYEDADAVRAEPPSSSPLARIDRAEVRPLPAAIAADTLRDPWLGRDKVLHATGSFLLTLSSQYVLTSKLDTSEDGALPVSAGVTLALGLAKEVADSRRPVRPLFSVRDLAADALGVALAVGLILL